MQLLYKILIFKSLFLLLTFTQTVHEVYLGDKDNIIELNFLNLTKSNYNNLNIKIVDLPSNIIIKDCYQNIGSLKINEEKTSQIIFKLSHYSKINEEGEIKIKFYENEILQLEEIIKYKVINPDVVELFQNYPNPFNPSTTIEYNVSSKTKVELVIYDLLGREITKLIDEVKEAGKYLIKYDLTKYNLSSGVYFYRLKTDNKIITKKMIYKK